MAERIDGVNLPASPAGRRRYPWNEWQDGSTWKVTEGEDYAVETETFRVMLHQRARATGMRVVTRVWYESGRQGQRRGLAFQFTQEAGK